MYILLVVFHLITPEEMLYGKYVLPNLRSTYLPFVTCDNSGGKPQKNGR